MTLSPEEINAITQLSAEERYEDFVTRIIEEGEIWGLSSEEGWAVINDDDEEFLPVWQDAELAQRWATDGYADCSPESVSLRDWMEKWLPGMIEDNLHLAVCPDLTGEGVVVSAEELLEDIRREIQ